MVDICFLSALSDNISQRSNSPQNKEEIEDKTIVYNNTLNGKPKFLITGNFNLDERTNTLNVHWAQGKLPNKLRVEKTGDRYLIAIGTTYYRKEH